ncbi:MAG: GGDEF domain-containing protein [Burkholderiales bacterium]
MRRRLSLPHQFVGTAIQMTVLGTAVIGALVFSFALGLRGISAFERADATRIEQINAGASGQTDSRFDQQAARLHADGRMALSGSALTLSMLAFGLLGLSLHERRRSNELAIRVESLIRTDGDTGAANRRAWEERLAHEIAQSRRLGYPLTIAMVNLDRFDAFIAKAGRTGGDRLLGELAGTWGPTLRKGDLMARYSGAIFALLLPGCPAEQAEALLARLRRLVPEQQTISAGVASWHWRESSETLLERTFAALDDAKARGGNRIALSQSIPTNVDRPAHKRTARVAVEETIA